MHSIQPTRRMVRGAPPRRRAFTLTELLVVIAIIAMLAAIVSVAVVRALDTAKQARIKTEVDQLDSAFKAYKEKYGSYPPCNLYGFDTPDLKQHVAQAFPRYNLSHLANDLSQTGLEQNSFRLDQALVFWLRGFSSDPQHPFVTLDDKVINNGMVTMSVAKRAPLFEFDNSRLVAVNKMGSVVPPGTATSMMPSYFPAGVSAGPSGAPYVYWDYRSYGDPPDMNNPPEPDFQGGWNSGVSGGPPVIFADAGVAVPYWYDANANNTYDLPPLEDWVNPESFQIIASGADGKYGAAAPLGVGYRTYPTGFNYDFSADLADDDNVTNFCDRARLEDAKP